MMKPLAVVACAGVLALAGCDEKGDKIEALDASLWNESEWISAVDAPVYAGKVKDGARAADGASWFVRGIENEGKVVSAKWMTSGLGIYELYVNGTRITKGLLAPYISNPDDILYYDRYDVKPLLKTGRNVIAILLGNGMRNAYRVLPVSLYTVR